MTETQNLPPSSVPESFPEELAADLGAAIQAELARKQATETAKVLDVPVKDLEITVAALLVEKTVLGEKLGETAEKLGASLRENAGLREQVKTAETGLSVAKTENSELRGKLDEIEAKPLEPPLEPPSSMAIEQAQKNLLEIFLQEVKNDQNFHLVDLSSLEEEFASFKKPYLVTQADKDALTAVLKEKEAKLNDKTLKEHFPLKEADRNAMIDLHTKATDMRNESFAKASAAFREAVAAKNYKEARELLEEMKSPGKYSEEQIARVEAMEQDFQMHDHLAVEIVTSPELENVLRRMGFYDYKDLSEEDKTRIERGIQRDLATQTYANVPWIMEEPETKVKILLSDVRLAREFLADKVGILENFLGDPTIDLSSAAAEALQIIGSVNPDQKVSQLGKDSLVYQAVAVIRALRAVKAATTLRWLRQQNRLNDHPKMEQLIDKELS